MLRMANSNATGWRVHQSRARLLKQRVIESCVEAVILGVDLAACYADGTGGSYMMADRSSPRAFQWSVAVRCIEHVDPSDHLVEGAETRVGHVLAHLLSEKEEKIDDVLGLSLESLSAALGLGWRFQLDRYSDGTCAS